MLLFLIVGTGLAVLIGWSVRRKKTGTPSAPAVNHSVHRAAAHFPAAVQVLTLVVEAGQLSRVVEHATMVNIAIALFLLTIVVATKSGAEEALFE